MSQLAAVSDRHVISQSIHPFQGIVQDIASGNVNPQTMRQLEEIHDVFQLQPHTLNHIVSKALQWRLGTENEKIDDNLYLAKSGIAQIDLFRLLIEELPHVAFAQNIVNKIIVDVCAPHQRVVLLDIGIGTGLQCSTIIRELAQKSSLLQEITIVGIEPSAESLVAATKRFQELQTEIGMRLNFHPICGCAEDISIPDWTSLIDQYRHQNVVINASFALHHIKNNAQHPDMRTDIFRLLYDFQPLAVLISEPNSDHLDENFAQRFENCFHHFNFVFQLINKLAISGDEKRALKLFFGREIRDIIGNHEELRSERHELATTWIDRLRKANFQLQHNYTPYLPAANEFIGIKATSAQFLSFEYQQESLVAVMYAVPAKV
jgi:hypothetical protein